MLVTRDANTVAVQILWIAHLRGRSFTPMQLLKLTYIAHGWTLGITGNPLFNDSVKAWKYGPVIPSVYHKYKKFGYSPISMKLKNLCDSFDNKSLAITERVVDAYGKYDGLYLSALTHQPDSPWDITMRQTGENTTIPLKVIRDYYTALVQE